jgi:AcrR family transcriptional regulator
MAARASTAKAGGGSLPELAATHPAAAPHERILDVARELFCRNGIHATGIDRILAAAGASKMTLYARFGSKEALLREVLVQEGEDRRATLFAAIHAAGSGPRARLAGIVAALDAWFREGRFTGCAYMNAVAEHTKGEPWLRDLAAEHHRHILGFLSELAAKAGAPEPMALAKQLLLLIDGAVAALMVSGDEAVLDIAGRNLRAILAQELGAA